MEFEWTTIVKTVNLTFIINILQFLILVWILNRILYKPVLRFINKRRNKISNLEAETQRLRNEAEELQKKRQELLENARKKHRTLVEEARKEGEKIKQEKLKEVKAKARKIIDEAELELRKEEENIREEMRKEIDEYAILSASKILEREID